MSLIISTVQQEKRRIDYMLSKYQEAISALPKGSLSAKQVNGNIYYYLKYRDGKKIISKYIVKEDVDSLRQQIDKRRHIEIMIKSLLEEQRLAAKILEGNL